MRPCFKNSIHVVLFPFLAHTLCFGDSPGLGDWHTLCPYRYGVMVQKTCCLGPSANHREREAGRRSSLWIGRRRDKICPSGGSNQVRAGPGTGRRFCVWSCRPHCGGVGSERYKTDPHEFKCLKQTKNTDLYSPFVSALKPQQQWEGKG